jgi:hypothetical protein
MGGLQDRVFCGLEQGKGVASFPLNREKVFAVAVEFASTSSTLRSALAAGYVRALDLAAKYARTLDLIAGRAAKFAPRLSSAHTATECALAGVASGNGNLSTIRKQICSKDAALRVASVA